MADVVPESDSQALHHFLSVSNWDSQAVMEQVAAGADALLGGTLDSCLVIDETSFPKKGTKSVGVARQWCGTLGTTDSCQVGVFASLGHGSQAALIDARLYLPRDWTDSNKRCRRAGVPESSRSFQTQPELALDIVSRARSQGVRFRCVAADGGYGKNAAFLRSLDDAGERFVVDVHRNQHIHLEDPQPSVPASSSGHHRRLVAQFQRQRYWIERAFQDAKSEAGMAAYQARSWKAWHHHMALVMMALLFMLQQRQKHHATHPKLSGADLKILLAHILPNRNASLEEVLRLMEQRHRRRQAATDSAYRRHKVRDGTLAEPGNLTK